MKDKIHEFSLSDLREKQNNLKEKDIPRINSKSYKEYEAFILDSYEGSLNILELKLGQIFGLNKTIKKEVIGMLIESMLEDKEYDVISHMNTHREFKEGW